METVLCDVEAGTELGVYDDVEGLKAEAYYSGHSVREYLKERGFIVPERLDEFDEFSTRLAECDP